MSFSKRRVLVTGGAGFIGSHVAEQLIERGHEVAIVDNLSTGKCDNVPEGARFYETDVRSDCTYVFEDFSPDTLSHHAAQINVRRSVHEPDFDADVNVISTIRLLQNCVQHNVRKIVFASTGGAVYGDQRTFPAAEDHPQYPLSPYGVSKLAAERYLHFYKVQYDLSYVALRYANVYGPRQDPYGEAGVVAVFATNLANNSVSTINGTGLQTRDYVYVEDVARANVHALENTVSSGAYNIGTGVETSVNQLYDVLRSLSGKNISPKYGPAKPGEQPRSSIDPTRASRALGWRPQVDLAAGLRRTYEFARAQHAMSAQAHVIDLTAPELRARHSA